MNMLAEPEANISGAILIEIVPALAPWPRALLPGTRMCTRAGISECAAYCHEP